MIANLVKNSWDQLKREEKEMEVRRNRFILYNIAELKSSIGHERLHHDKTKVLIVLGALSLGEIIIVQCFRLGSWKDHAVNPRPLLVHVENCEVMDRVLCSAGKLRSSFGSDIWLMDVFIQPDRSKKERDLRCSVVEQLKEKRKSGERCIIQGDKIV